VNKQSEVNFSSAARSVDYPWQFATFMQTPLRISIMMRILAFLFLSLIASTAGAQQQTGDFVYDPQIQDPVHRRGSGPIVAIDQAHNNFHTATGRFAPFARVLTDDGYRIDSLTTTFSRASLDRVDVLVIANPLHESNLGNWVLPNPSAYSKAEIGVVYEWVDAGGSMLLIADHMPFPGAAGELAARFGFRFNNGFAMRTDGQGIFSFTIYSENRLVDHPITRGFDPGSRIDSVTTFTGQAFQAGGEDVEPLLVFGPGYHTLTPERAWQFDENTPTESVEGWLQGAVKRVGNGRIAVFGEAAGFSAQVSGNMAFGMNSRDAPQNQRFLRNVMQWLTAGASD